MSNLKPIYVNVKAKSKHGALEFGVKWKTLKWWPFWNDDPIELKPDTGGHEMMFNLIDDTDLDLLFLSDATDAIWVQPDTCPAGKCNNGGQITPVSVENGGKQLRVTNANTGDPVDLHYALNFNGKPSTTGPPYSHDPVIRNGGGTNIN
ncbi:MAG: hypothetical protein ABIN68_01025 [Sphingomicrobium sp.]